MSPLNEVVPANIELMLVTRDTSHFEMSPLKELASYLNIPFMSVMLDTPHSLIGPSGPLWQSPFGDNFRHASTALLSSDLDCGGNAGMELAGRGETVGLNSKFWDRHNEIESRLYYMRQGSDLGKIGNVNLRTHHHCKNSATC